MNVKKRRLTPICAFHYLKLIYRTLLFILALTMYIFSRVKNTGELFRGFENEYWVLGIIAIVYTTEMIMRFFPSRLESMGCQKQFAKNYIPIDNAEPKQQSWKRTFAVALAWAVLNGIIGALYYTRLIDKGILILISLAYGVCDIICILFFCPFQTWFMKNRCCTTCRIYNWDFAMMFTPLVFIPSWYTYGLLGCSLALLLRWEITYRRHPERFSTATNKCLDCSHCEEKLCSHKKQLQSFIRKHGKRFFSSYEVDRKKGRNK